MEATMLKNYFDQVEAADRLGYNVAWVAQSPLNHRSEDKQESGSATFPWRNRSLHQISFNSQELHSHTNGEDRSWFRSALSILANGGPIATAGTNR